MKGRNIRKKQIPGGMTERKGNGRVLQELCDAFAEAGGADGFDQALGEAGVGHLFGGDFGKCCGERHDRNIGEGGNLAQGDCGGVPIESGHLEIQNDQIRGKVGSLVYRLPAIGGFENNIPLSFKDSTQ